MVVALVAVLLLFDPTAFGKLNPKRNRAYGQNVRLSTHQDRPDVGGVGLERLAQTPFREVFPSTKAPFRPLGSMAISGIVRRYMKKAGVEAPGAGSRNPSLSLSVCGRRKLVKTEQCVHVDWPEVYITDGEHGMILITFAREL